MTLLVALLGTALVLDFVYVVQSGSFDCYTTGCSTDQDIARLGLLPLLVGFILALAAVVVRAFRRRP